MCFLSGSFLFPPRLRQEKAFFSLHWWTGYSSALYSKRNRVYFLSASIQQPVSKNVFLLVWQTRFVSLCVNVYILMYMCGRTKWALLFVCWCFLSACYFTCDWSAVLRAALLPKQTTGSYIRSYPFFYTFCLFLAFFTRSR